MLETVIRVDNLGKKYTITHQSNGGYTTLREQLAGGTKSLGRRLIKPFLSGISRPEHEDFWALKGISFEVKRGDRLGIIGRNGAGKSTLLKLLSRITEPSCGRIITKGRVASLLEVGTGFHPELTGKENIYLNGAILGMSKTEIKSKFDEIVAFAEVEKFLDTPVKRYSSGMYVRLAFAVAAHLEPEILVVDEVLAVGDTQFQQKCLGKMEEVSQSGRTVLFVSHNMGAISLLCQNVLLLNKGSVLSYGNTQDGIKSYVNECGNRIGTLLDYQKIYAPELKVTDVTVNQSEGDTLHLKAMEHQLSIELTLISQTKRRVALEARLKDAQGKPLAFYCPGHIDRDNNTFLISPGKHKIFSDIALPKLNRGRYFLELEITEPGICGLISFPFGLELQVDGYSSNPNLVFDHGRDGYQLMEGRIDLESIYSN